MAWHAPWEKLRQCAHKNQKARVGITCLERGALRGAALGVLRAQRVARVVDDAHVLHLELVGAVQRRAQRLSRGKKRKVYSSDNNDWREMI